MGWTLSIERGPGVLLKEMRRALELGNRAVGERWHREFLPKHFTEEAYSRYQYKPRQGAGQQKLFPIDIAENQTPVKTNKYGIKYFRYRTHDGKWHTSHGEMGYQAYKLKKFHHTLPLVFTGRLRAAVRGAVKILATSKGVTIRMSGPRWLRGLLAFRGRGGTGPDMYVELTTITRDEAEALQRTLKDAVVKHLADAREHKEIR